ncbi:transport and Golgi organization protein 2 isoform X1 [Danaus plexippus]|uniref:transport and Golgi organization protein 2 isoform X1 n=1 Tax=Danaus plexippus TaxID=13037 RepID=UPI002AAFCF34|nr:transport and Golgi organization protein 2 isoform X1 [Danaus plexippus]
MCIVFIYNGKDDVKSDYRFILVSNRDEYYNRPAQPLDPWTENPNVYGGRDLQPGSGSGTWMAINPVLKKLGLLLNLPGSKKENVQSRGRIVADFVKSHYNTKEYVEIVRDYATECNDFIFISLEYGGSEPTVNSYTNVTDKIEQWTETYLGFGNSLPDKPLKKVEAGKEQLKNICHKYSKITDKAELIEELTRLLKNTESNLPDSQLENRQPHLYKELSSIFVSIPKAKYGTRAHTILLVTKSGYVDLIEISMKSPINVEAPYWERKEFKFDLI